MYPDKQKRFELRRLIDEAELMVEVSEAEKILSQLAYLMNLYIDNEPYLQDQINCIVGSVEFYRKLSPKKRAALKDQASQMKLRSERVLFWMWRSWILQKDISADSDAARVDSGLESIGHLEEWDRLPKNVLKARQQTRKEFVKLQEVGASLTKVLHSKPGEMMYVFDRIQGSPLGIIEAFTLQVEGLKKEVDMLKKVVQKAYGFGKNHRHNKRFDTHTIRNVTAFYWWNQGVDDERMYELFMAESGKFQVAKTKAIKEASRYADKVQADFESKLEEIERTIGIPSRFYARTLPGTKQGLHPK